MCLVGSKPSHNDSCKNKIVMLYASFTDLNCSDVFRETMMNFADIYSLHLEK